MAVAYGIATSCLALPHFGGLPLRNAAAVEINELIPSKN